MRIRAFILAALVGVLGDVRGDSVELTTGGALRGIDLKKQGSGYVFTLENGEPSDLHNDGTLSSGDLL